MVSVYPSPLGDGCSARDEQSLKDLKIVFEVINCSG
jgi:hypothetical protein